MIALAERQPIAPVEHTSEQRRWERWQTRYQRSARRTTLQARVVAVLVFAAIIANLVVQLLRAGRA